MYNRRSFWGPCWAQRLMILKQRFILKKFHLRLTLQGVVLRSFFTVPHDTLATVTIKNGKQQVNGKQKKLKATGSYPKKMGTTTITTWLKHSKRTAVVERKSASYDWKLCLE